MKYFLFVSLLIIYCIDGAGEQLSNPDSVQYFNGVADKVKFTDTNYAVDQELQALFSATDEGNMELVQQIANKEFNFAPFFLSTALSFFAVAEAMPVKLALYKEKNEAKYTTHYLQIAALVALSNKKLGELYLKQLNFDKSKNSLDLAMKYFEQVGDKHTLDSLYCDLGILAYIMGDEDIALRHLDSCQVIASANNLLEVLFNAYYQKAKYYEDKKDYKEALRFYLLYEELRQNILIDKGLITEAESMLMKQMKENEILRLEKAKQKRKTLIVLLSSLLFLAIISAGSIKYISQLRQKGKLESTLVEIQKQHFKVVIEAQERERKRIASDLHDSVGQMLSLTKLRMSDLLDCISQLNSDYEEDVQKTISVLDEACQEVRQISHNLMPGSLIRLGFVAATKDLIRKINQNGKLNVDFRVVNIDERLDEKVEVTLYRILQEILNNVIKHSKADKIYIVLGKEEKQIELSVRDNGVGFDTKSINSSLGIGWKNINSRLSVINGKIDVNSEVGKGVYIKMQVPA